MNETSSGDYDESATRFGTRQPPLTTRLKRILSDYPPGAQILKELIQNADDAGARNVGFLIDPRAHPSTNLLMPSLSELQGPALLAWNDAQFGEEDWQSIGRLDRSAKEGNVLKVGRFGIGFQSVHHITDVPVIISGPDIGILDPHTSFVSSKDDEEEHQTGRPPYWEGTALLMPMNPSSMEYQEVRRLFDTTMLGRATIRNIERVQNLDLWNRYCDCRRRMQSHMPSAGEKKLFHGTRDNSPDLVYEGDAGFDLRHSSGGMWGVGSYFAVNASYSHKYAYSGSANRQMFVAKVLTGSCVRMPPNGDFKFPPERQDPQQAGIRRRHNSVQGFTNGSEVYIIYDNAQSYPAYLISYSM